MLRNLAVTALAAAALAACGGQTEPEVEDTPAAVDAPVETPAEPKIVEPVGEVFDGASDVVDTYDPQIGLYTINAVIESAAGIATSDYSDTTPPMPMATSGFAVFVEPEGYRFQMVSNDGEREAAVAGSPDEVTTVQFSNTEDGGVLIVNGEVVWTGFRARPMPEMTWGRGFLERYWTGTILERQVCLTPAEATVASIEADLSLAVCAEE